MHDTTLKQRLRPAIESLAWVSASAYLNAGIQVIRGVLFARVLGASAYGVWTFLMTVQSLVAPADLGISRVTWRDLPGLQARGEQRQAETLQTLTLLWVPIAYALAGMTLALLWPAFGWPAAPRWRIVVPVFLLAWGVYCAAEAITKGSMAFRRFALLTISAGLGGLVAGAFWAQRAGVTGLALAQAAVFAVTGLVVVRRSFILSPIADLVGAWRRAVAEGWPLVLNGLAAQVFVSVDVLIVARAMSVRDVGLYGLALTGSSMVAALIAGSVGTVAGQHLFRQAAVSETGAPPPSLVWGPAAALSLALAPACAVAAWLTPTVLRAVLPQYREAAVPAMLLMAAAYYLQSQSGFSTTFVAVRRPLATVPLYVILTGLNIGLDVVLLRAGYGLLGIALGSLVVNMGFHVSHQLLVGAFVRTGRRQGVQMVASLAAGGLPLAVAAASVGQSALAGVLAVLGLSGCLGLIAVTRRWLVRPM